MALSPTRILVHGDTHYPWEREGIDFVESQLPNSDPYHVWELVQLLDPSSGRFYEIDLLVLGYSAIYVMELKGGPGTYRGDSLDWERHVPGERTHYMDPPLRLTDHKCKVLKSLLSRKLKRELRCPRIEPLVLLSHPEAKVELDPSGRIGVVTRAEVRDALVRHKFFGSPPNWRADPIDAPLRRGLIEAAKAIGLRPRKAQEMVGQYRLDRVLGEGPGFQDRLAIHTNIEAMRRRARVYLVPEQTSIERRQQYKRAADREVSVLLDVRGSPFILSCTEYVTDAERGPTVLFEDFDGALPLDAFLRKSPELSFDDRVALIEQLAHALAYCHKRSVTHGAVAPGSVLVRRANNEKLELRLFNFQLASGERISDTLHISQLSAEAWAAYQAPEVREDPTTRSPVSDVFGLGAVAYLILTGKAPGETPVDVDARLQRDGFLDPRSEDVVVEDAVVEALEIATALQPANRYPDAVEWFEFFADRLTRSDKHEPVLSPLDAEPGNILDELRVERVLGHGASSRVLEVTRLTDERRFALKVSLNEDQDARLRAEAAILEQVRHPRIVKLIAAMEIAERTCLLMELAGERTLHRELSREGTISLDYAARYGEDLLSALEELEERKIIHRDIKPANIGIGSQGKEANHLTLFDFSLADAPDRDLGVGTAAYRDPFLRERGGWDHAADRYSAAITMHEMIAGVRPSWGGDGGVALDENAELSLAAERFDPAAREGLLVFFRRALARQVEQRFATARDMRKAWERALEEPRRLPSVHPVAAQAADEEALTDAQIQAIPPDTPVEALPLSTRARNALDRAGIRRVDQLHVLAANRISAIRGIGTKVAKEILDFRERWRRGPEESAQFEPFYTNYRGEDVALELSGWPSATARALCDAGISGFVALAATAKQQVLTLCKRNAIDVAPLHARLDAEHKQVSELEHPRSLESFLAALLSKAGKSRQYLEALFGLSEPFVGRTNIAVAEVAKHFGVTPANVHAQLSKQRARWAALPLADDLTQRASEVVRESAGAVSLARAAQLLAASFPTDDASTEPLRQARAAALLRIAAELEREREKQLQLVRLRDGEPWLFTHEPNPEKLAELGKLADALASREPLASPMEAQRQLGLVVENTALATLTAARLLELACHASQRAECSARLEVYPRNLAPERALALTASILKSGVSPDEVVQRAQERYPAAAALPPRPELDALMQRIGFSFREHEQRYVRLGDTGATNIGTAHLHSDSRFATAATGQPRKQTLPALAARDFDQRLRAAVEDDAFRVLGVSIDQGAKAARWLAHALGVPALSFDQLFLRELQQFTQSGRPSLDLVLQTDGEGREHPGWNNLKKLAERCAERVLDQLVPARAPLLLHQLGLVERYELTSFLHKFVQAAQSAQSRAVFLLVPCPDTGAAPRINGQLAIPGMLPGQALWVPLEWINNHHNAAA